MSDVLALQNEVVAAVARQVSMRLNQIRARMPLVGVPRTAPSA